MLRTECRARTSCNTHERVQPLLTQLPSGICLILSRLMVRELHLEPAVPPFFSCVRAFRVISQVLTGSGRRFTAFVLEAVRIGVDGQFPVLGPAL